MAHAAHPGEIAPRVDMPDKRAAHPEQGQDARPAHQHAQQRQPGEGLAVVRPGQDEEEGQGQTGHTAGSQHEADEDALAPAAVLAGGQGIGRLSQHRTPVRAQNGHTVEMARRCPVRHFCISAMPGIKKRKKSAHMARHDRDLQVLPKRLAVTARSTAILHQSPPGQQMPLASPPGDGRGLSLPPSVQGRRGSCPRALPGDGGAFERRPTGGVHAQPLRFPHTEGEEQARRRP